MRLLQLFVLLFVTVHLFGQKMPSEKTTGPLPLIVCPHSDENSDHYVPPRKNVKTPYKNQSITFVPTYIVANESLVFPEEAKRAIEDRVFPIVAQVFSSPIPVNVHFTWDQTQGLAGASPFNGHANFDNHVQWVNTWYPTALAEKIAMREINHTDSADIRVTINQNVEWCFDCETPLEAAGKYDFVSTLLHELYHGLGFTATSAVDDAGSGFQINSGTAFIFNNFMETGEGERTRLVEDGPELGNLFQSNNLFFKLQSSTNKPKLYAPSSYRPGSSISHLDETIFNNTEHALMTPSSRRGEVERSAGVSDQMMYDMGWVYTYLLHEEDDLEVEKPIDQDFTVSVDVQSDNGYDASTLMLHYSADEFITEDVVVPLVQNANGIWEATIPSNGQNRAVYYYVEVVDDRGIRFSNPGISFDGLQAYNLYSFGPDNLAPEVTHDPVASIKSFDPSITLFAKSNDDFRGVDTMIVEWLLNGVAQAPAGFVKDSTLFEPDRFRAVINLPDNLSGTDVLQYRVVAIDKSSLKNEGYSPLEGYYTVAIEEVAEPVISYANDFNTSNQDFKGNGLEIREVSGFQSAAIHSPHPYPSAGNDNTLNYILELQQPITLLGPDQAIMTFDEVAFVEPGDPGVPYGREQFWDYVVVEGKISGGDEWLPFIDGWDARAHASWESEYNDATTGGVSSARANFLDIKERTINMLESGNFAEGDVILIRFRMFIDEAAHGWGWMVDNLVIQDQSTAVEDYILQENLYIAPNPADKEVMLTLALEQATDQINVQIYDLSGKMVREANYERPTQVFRHVFDTSDLHEGTYVMKIMFDQTDFISRKFVIQR